MLSRLQSRRSGAVYRKEVGDSIRNPANFLTMSRVAFAVAMSIAPPLSTMFWICYVCGGISDILDGLVARRLGIESAAGAKLDSIADLAFAAAVFVTSIRSAVFPVWLWLCIAGITLLKVIGYGVGFYKFHTFAGLHTLLNKAAGTCIFAFPLLYAVLGMSAAGIVVCGIAFLASLEELIIMLLSKELERNRKSLFC